MVNKRTVARYGFMSERRKLAFGIGGFIAIVASFLAIVAAWATHVIVCIKVAAWILLIVGIFVPPIGILHGFAIWFGIL